VCIIYDINGSGAYIIHDENTIAGIGAIPDIESGTKKNYYCQSVYRSNPTDENVDIPAVIIAVQRCKFTTKR